MADTVGKINPFLYRGYYYDSETGLYYLNSRYYDPETGRFINADGAVSTGTGILGFNMFSYCNNDPTGMVDDGGSRPLAMSDTVESAEDQMIAAKFNSEAHRRTALAAAKNTEVNPKRTSSNGVKFIASYESFVPSPKDDGFGNLTVGYGHLVKKGEHFGKLSQQQALELLASDLSGWESIVTNYSDTIDIVWDQNQYDAFVSLAFNSGNNFKSVMKAIAAGADPYDSFGMINRVNGKPVLGLYRRRMDEADMFVHSTYNRTYRNW